MWYCMAGKVENKKITAMWKWEQLLCFVIGQASGTFEIIASVSGTKITRSHGPITLWMWMFSTALHLLMYSLAGNRNFARKEELIFETIYRIPHLQCRPSWVTAHAQLPFPWCNYYKESAASPITKAREYMQYHISFFHTFSHLRNLKQWVHRGVTTPQVQQRVWSEQQS